MLSIKTKWVIVSIAIIFAILQVLRPFIHAHTDVDNHAHSTGFHIGVDHEEYLTPTLQTVSVDTHASHIVSVTSAIQQDTNLGFFVDATDSVLFALCFSVVFLLSVPRHYLQRTLSSYQLRNRRPQTSRAPPRF